MKSSNHGYPPKPQRWNQVRPDDGNAFLPDPYGTRRMMPEHDAEAAAEEFIGTATMGESVSEDARDEVTDEEAGGPFVMLDDEARLLSEPEESEPEKEGHDSVQKEQTLRGARWLSRRP